jgi:Ca2+-transporting ATPase
MFTPPTPEKSHLIEDNYCDPVDRVLARLGSNEESGLSTVDAWRRLLSDGPNAVENPRGFSKLGLFLSQFTSSVVLLLVAAAVISAFLHQYLQTAGIGAAILINAAVGFITEYKSRISLQQLASLTQPIVRVCREGNEFSVPSSEIVAGDIVLLQSGDRVCADLRLLSDAPVTLDESILTGESIAVFKTARDIQRPEQAVLFQGTTVLAGRARGVVIATGSHTRLGKLASTMMQLDGTKTPLDQQLARLGRQLTMSAVLLCTIFGVIGSLKGLPILMMLETSIALAVAAIPEGLPLVATIALAMGIFEMVKHRALVRRLSAVETLGCASVICTDKTGTLTENKMVVTDLVACFERYGFEGDGYAPIGAIERVDQPGAPPSRTRLQELLLPALLCNDASLEDHGEGWHVHGDPTEGALLVAGAKAEMDQQSLLRSHARIAELPFDLARMRMSTLNKSGDGSMTLYCKGAPKSVLSVCSKVAERGSVVDLQEHHRNWIRRCNEELAESGLRVLALASKPVLNFPVCIDPAVLEDSMTFIGLIAMRDPVKPEAKAALSKCRQAGIRVIMLTGDQPNTACAIGKQLGICASNDELLRGDELTADDGSLSSMLNRASVFARVTPELKLRLVQVLQRQGHVVAMTGDGVNDAPALKQSDIGIAIGAASADLAKDAAALVITDGNFGTIVEALSAGRQIYNKIKSTVGYLLSASWASIAVTGAGIFFYTGLLLTPLQLLWLNLIMHIFPCIGLIAQNNWDDFMQEAPRKRTQPLVDSDTGRDIALRGSAAVVAALIAAGIEECYWPGSSRLTSIVLATVSASLLVLSWTWLRVGNSVPRGFPMNLSHLRATGPMTLNTAIGFALLMAALYVPVLNAVLETQPLSLTELAMCLGLSLVSYLPFGLAKSGFRMSEIANRHEGITEKLGHD